MIWNIDPHVFPGLEIPRWYGLLFAGGFFAAYWFLRRMFRADGQPQHLLDSLLFYVLLGTMIGMRLAHCFLYEPAKYLADPLEILMIWRGGYASHGGFLGLIVAMVLFTRKHREVSFWWVADRVAVVAMLAAGAVRVGNFFNSEILGHPTGVPWAVTFARVDNVPRHPAQLYEAIGYLAIFGVFHALYSRTRMKQRPSMLFASIMILGFLWRAVVENYKENQEAFEDSMPLNMGQLLSVPFILAGLILLWRARRA